MAKIIGARFEINGIKNTVDKLADLELELNNINKELREAKKNGKNADFKEFRQAQEGVKNSIKETRAELRFQQRQFAATKFPKDSVIGLEQSYSRLRKQVRGLSKDQRNSTFGKDLIKEANRTKSAILKTNNSIKDFSTNIGNYGSAFNRVGGLLASAGIFLGVQEVVQAVKQSIKTFGEFNQQVATLGAISGATTIELLELEQQSLSIGATTQFTATEVAKLQTELARLGFSTQEIKDSTRAITDLSIATGEEIDQTAKIVGQTIKAYGLEATDAGNVTDILAASFNSSALQLGTFAEASKLLAPVAKTLGVSLAESTAAIGLLADSGLEGTIATQTLGTAFQRLADPTKKYAKIAEELGIEIFDQKGNFVGLGQTLKNLEGVTKDYTDEQKLATISQIFGVQSAKTFTTILNAQKNVIGENGEETLKGADALLAYTDELKNVNGEAARTAAIVGDTLAQDLLKLTSATEAAQISMVGFFENGLRKATTGVTGLVSAVGDYFTIPLSDKLEDERIGFNALTQVLIDNNEKGEKRNLIVDELQKRYPDYIKNLDLETASVDDLRNNLAEVNSELVNRIILEQQKEKLTKLGEQEVAQQRAILRLEEQRAAVQAGEGGTVAAIDRALGLTESNLRSNAEAIDLFKDGLEKTRKEIANVIEEGEKLKGAFDFSTGAEAGAGGVNPDSDAAADKKKADAELAAAKSAAAAAAAARRNADAKREETFTVEQLEEALRKLRIEYANIVSQPDEFLNATELEKSSKAIEKVQKQLENVRNIQTRATGVDEVAQLDRVGETGFSDVVDLFEVNDEARIEGEKKTNEEIEKLRKESEERRAKESLERTENEEREKQAKIQQGIDIGFDLANQAADALSNLRNQKLERELSNRENQLQENFDREFEAAEGNEALQLELEQRFEQEKEKLQKEASKRRKSNAKKEALIQGALAILKTFAQFGFPAGVLPAIGQAAATAIQIAAIDKQEFADGGLVQQENGKVKGKANIKPTTRGDNKLVVAKVGEMFLNEKSQRKAEYLYGNDIWRNLDIPQFADGGIVSTGSPQIVKPQRVNIGGGRSTTNVVQLTDRQAERQANIIAKEVAKQVRTAVSGGFKDKNRREERENLLTQNTGI